LGLFILGGKKMNEPTEKEIIQKAKTTIGWVDLVSHRKSFDELQDYCDKFAGNEKVIAHTIMLMTYNTKRSCK
jgi:hypothetical protein